MRAPPQPLIRAISAHLEAAWPREGCGLVVAPGKFIPIANSSPRADAYSMDFKEILAALKAGGALWAIVHSHVDAEAYFSSEDVRMAIGPDGEPLWPGVQQLVIPVHGGRAGRARCYRWDPATRHFRERQVLANLDDL